MKLIITGGSGLLAINWAVALRDRFSVTLTVHDRDVSLAGVRAQEIELESVDDIVSSLEVAQPQMVIHTAGLANVDRCEADPALARHINVDLAANVAQACAKLGLPLVHISTDHLFSGESESVDETTSVAPINVYGWTKAEAETRVLEAHPLALVIRTNFYGWGTSYRHSFSDQVIDALRAGKELILFQDVFYTPILVETLAQAVHDLIEHKVSGIFHVVGDERTSKYCFGLKIAEEFSLDVRLIKPGFITDQVSLAPRPHDMSLSNEKTCKLLGRDLGGVSEHILRLHQQEQSGLAREIQKQ